MFFVSDRQDYKKIKINAYLSKEPMIAVLFAAANFEWTLGRCILFLSNTPNIELREKLIKTYGLAKYKELWRDELIKSNPEIPPLAKIVKTWDKFTIAFNLRHSLIHGRNTCTKNMARKPIEIMLRAVDDLYAFADSKNINLHQRLPIRRKKKIIN